MVHGLIGIVLRRAAPLKLLNYKLTRRSRMDGLGNSIRDSRISSASIFSASRKVVPSPSPSRNDRFSPRSRAPTKIIFLPFFLFIILPLQIKFRFIARETNNIIESNTNERIEFARASLVFVHHSRSSPRSNKTDRYVFRKKCELKKNEIVDVFARQRGIYSGGGEPPLWPPRMPINFN